MDPASAAAQGGKTVGAGQFVGPALQAGTGIISTWMTNRANRKMAEYAYSKDLEQWHRQNEYNSPAAQMQRLEEAGLNPNMVYGQGVQGATGQAKEMPKYQAPRIDWTTAAPQVMQMLNMYQDLEKKKAETRYIDRQSAYTMTRDTLAYINTRIKEIEQEIKSRERDWMMERNKQYPDRSNLYQTLNDKYNLINEKRVLTKYQQKLLQQNIMKLKTINRYLPATMITGMAGVALRGMGSLLSPIKIGR